MDPTVSMRRPAAALLLAAALLALPAPAGAQTPRGLGLGYFDHVFTTAAGERGPWLGRVVSTGADIVRIDIGWAEITPARAQGFDAGDPSDPAYRFARADEAIVDATARGLRVLVSFTRAPAWAEGPDRPASAEDGTWRPDPNALRDFGEALGRRYSGSFPDPARPGFVLPRVEGFQVWNEPNLEKYISPQWSAGRTFAPAHYRRMLNAFHRGLRSVNTSALVVTGGTAPFGDAHANAPRIMPVRFVRELLCLEESGRRLRGARCNDPARFDVLAHHPYSIGQPRRPADRANDVSIPDLGKLTRLLRASERVAAQRSRRAATVRRHPLWVTEVSYDSKPPDVNAVPLLRHARWMEETFYLLWRQGVETVMWFQARDADHDPTQALNQSGSFFRNGMAKPAARAFRFPLVAERGGRGWLRVWGRSPVAGMVRIERRVGSAWKVVRLVRAARRGTFILRVPAEGRTVVRARVGGETSLPWLDE